MIRIAGVQLQEHRQVEATCATCGQPSVYSFAPRASPVTGIHGVGRRKGGSTPWIVACNRCRLTVPMATGSTEAEAIKDFKKRIAERTKKGG